MSEYERDQVASLIDEVCRQCGGGLDGEELRSNCWLAYFEMKKKLAGCSSFYFWPVAAEHMIRAAEEMRAARNDRYSLESRMSLNQIARNCGKEIGDAIFPKGNDFTRGVALWDYARRLGETKYRIICYLAQGEEDDYIIEKMAISESRYLEIMAELREDLKDYIN